MIKTFVEWQLSEDVSIIHTGAGTKEPDNDQWTNRFKIHSSSSNRVYVVAQNKNKRHWGCSCPGWKMRRKCKHLATLGLPSHEVPYEARIE